MGMSFWQALRLAVHTLFMPSHTLKSGMVAWVPNLSCLDCGQQFKFERPKTTPRYNHPSES